MQRDRYPPKTFTRGVRAFFRSCPKSRLCTLPLTPPSGYFSNFRSTQLRFCLLFALVASRQTDNDVRRDDRLRDRRSVFLRGCEFFKHARFKWKLIGSDRRLDDACKYRVSLPRNVLSTRDASLPINENLGRPMSRFTRRQTKVKIIILRVSFYQA